MAGFSIDDVRDSFSKDIGGFIAQIEKSARTLTAADSLDVAGLVTDAVFELDRTGDAGHSIAGTSSLVGADSLADTARLIEELVLRGKALAQELERKAQRVRAIAELCGDGAAALRVMLELELGRRSGEAKAIAEQWEAKVLAAASEAPAPMPSAEHDEFRFDEAPEGSTTSVDGELLGAFRQEAREALVTLQGYLQLLANRPDDRQAAVQVERIFHTLKGASAAIGLSEVNRLARALQHTTEQVASGATALTPMLLDQIVVEANALLEAAGVPTLAPLADARRPPPEQLGARRFFVSEARQLVDDARRILPQLTAASVKRAKEMRAELGRLFHRLKGSALIVSEGEIARAAADLQALCEGRSANVTHIDLQLAGIEGLIGRMTLGPSSSTQVAKPEVEITGPVRERVQFVGDAELWDSFELECTELIDGIEQTLARLDGSARPKAELEALMRLYHTLKGALNTVGLTPVGKSVHLVEDVLEKLLELAILPPMSAIETVLSDLQRTIRKNLSQARQGFVDTSNARLEAQLDALLGSRHETAHVHGAPSSRGSEIREARPATHESRDSQADLEEQASDIERRFLRVSLERLDGLMNLAGELVVGRSRLSSRVASLRTLQSELGRSRRRLVDAVDRFRDMYEFANLDGTRARKQEAEASDGFGALELDRYDDVHVLARSLAEIAGDGEEIDRAMITELSQFGYDSESFSGIVSGIQSEVTRARMVPLGAMFTRLRFTARDVAERDKKQVRVETAGEEVSLDKTMADALFGPLLHLVRNAVGHGIEPAEVREAIGKDAQGIVRLVARQESGQIVIEVEDDGAGLDLAKLRERGAELGLVRADVALDAPEVSALVFARGVSTRAEATDTAGRGVGGEVVKRAVERLNGSVRVSTSPGSGTTFRVTVPLTLAITRAITVRASGQSFAIPLYFADRILSPDEATIVESAGARRIQVDGAFQPLRALDDVLNRRGEPMRGPIIVLRVGDRRVGLQVDAVLGQEEIVVKGLGELLSGHPLFAGLTLRGSGELVLILDVLELVETRMRQQDTERDVVVVARPEERAVEPVPAATKARLRVLFVDDSLSVRKVAERALSGLGVEVTVAVDGVDGLEKLRSGTYDVVFTDLEMPRMNGYELVREMRYIPAYQKLPIAVVSSRSADKHRAQAHALGVNDYLTKPFTAESLLAALDRLLGSDWR